MKDGDVVFLSISRFFHSPVEFYQQKIRVSRSHRFPLRCICSWMIEFVATGDGAGGDAASEEDLASPSPCLRLLAGPLRAFLAASSSSSPN